jgi:sporulation protein YlmC with PRC-barrel domain/CBS domain-containing protein
MRTYLTPETSLSLLEGAPVVDRRGRLCGKLSDIAVGTASEAGKVTGLVLKTKEGRRLVDIQHVRTTASGALQLREGALLQPLDSLENHLLLQQDIVDRQIVDVHGRKVVRVNDVDLRWLREDSQDNDDCGLHVSQVEVGLRGALRRLLKGTLPPHQIDRFTRQFSARIIPWEFVDFIEVDPARRVKLKIEHPRLASMHPSDIADILEELAPAERDAVFGSLDEETAAEALEEIHPRLQQSLTESLDSGRVADIVEEMDPGAAADFLAELPDERSEAILGQMEPEERQEVEELLEFRDNSAAGRMTTEFIQLPQSGTVADAIQALQTFDGYPETVTDLYLVDEREVLKGAVPLGRLLLVPITTKLSDLREEQLISCAADAHEDEVAELFDKYNLRALPVVGANHMLVGVIQADHVISFLRKRS